MAELPGWLNWHPHVIPDPGPEVYQIMSELGPERALKVVEAINAARSEVEAARAAGYKQIGAAISQSGGS